MFGLPTIPWYYKALAVIGLIVGAYIFGRHDGTIQAKLAIAQYEALKKTSAEELQKEKNNIKEKIVVQYVDRIKTITKTETKFVDRINDNEKDKDVILSSTWTCLHDANINHTDPDLCLKN